MQTCSNSTVKSTIEVNFYKSGSSTTAYVPTDIVVDSSNNRYLAFYEEFFESLFVTKIAPDGTFSWIIEYGDLYFTAKAKVIALSSDETKLRMLSQFDQRTVQLVEVYANNGTTILRKVLDSLEILDAYRTNFVCSGTEDSSNICFFLGLGTQDSNQKVWKFDFANPSYLIYTDSNDTNHQLTSVTPIDDDNVIVSGYDPTTTPQKFIIYSSNFSSTSMNWAVEANTFEDIYATVNFRNTYGHLSSDSTKYSCILYRENSYQIIVLNSNNGTLIETKHLTYSTNFTGVSLVANGWISDDMIVLSLSTSTENSNMVDFINTNDWTLTSFKGSSRTELGGFSQLFNTDQIILLLQDIDNQVDFSLQIGYDKFHMTEFFTQ